MAFQFAVRAVERVMQEEGKAMFVRKKEGGRREEAGDRLKLVKERAEITKKQIEEGERVLV